MRAAVYRGEGRVAVEELPVPSIGPGELLVRVAVCGVCPTDVKKIHDNLLPPPRLYGHETAGTVEPVNTCLKGIRQTKIRAGETVLVQGQGPIGLLLLALAKREGCKIIASDPMPERLAFAQKFGADLLINPRNESVVERVKQATE